MERLCVAVVAEEGPEVRGADDSDGEGHHVLTQREVLARRDAGPVGGQVRADRVDLARWGRVESSV